MLFSRWPFATMSSAGLDSDVRALLQLQGLPIPAAVPVVDFVPYDDTDGNDGDAAKGILYMRVQRSASQIYHVFFSHTQADADVLEEHAGARGRQIAYVEKFIERCTGGFPAGQEVFFLGDLNIWGEPANSAEDGREWKNYFHTPGRVLSDRLVDLWGRRQCVGSPGLRDPGFTATVRYPPQEQRLDYIFGLAASGLAAQHLMIDYDLAQVPPGHAEVSYLSDHRPLRLDLALPRSHSTPHGAMVPVFPPPPALAQILDMHQLLLEGQVKWYRFNAPGTYDFRLDEGADRCGFEVYLDTDLSRPRQRYRLEESPDFGVKYVLPSAPFLVKVFPFSRDGEARFFFRAHRHQGLGPWDAIQLPYGSPVPEAFPSAGQMLNTDSSQTAWDDADTKWFRLDGPQIPVSRPLEVRITIEATSGDAPFGAALAKESAGTWTLLDQQGPGERRYRLRTHLANGEQLYVQVRRADGLAPRDLEVEVTARCDVSLLLGGQRGAPRLLCTKETSGWGADDIELGITVDGVELRYIRNDEIGDMEQDAVRDLDQWIPDLVPYFTGVEFKVVELDDTSPDDIGQETLRLRDQLASWSDFTVTKADPDMTLRGCLRVHVDDGSYDVQVSVTTWDERF